MVPTSLPRRGALQLNELVCPDDAVEFLAEAVLSADERPDHEGRARRDHWALHYHAEVVYLA